MIPDVYGVLSGSTALMAIVNGKIYRTAAPETAAGVPVAAPYVVWSIVSASPENNLTELPDTDNARIQVDCYAPQNSQALCTQMKDAAQAAIEAVTNVISGPWETKEPETKLWRWSFDSSWWTDR